MPLGRRLTSDQYVGNPFITGNLLSDHRDSSLDPGYIALRQSLVDHLGAVRNERRMKALPQSLAFDVGVHSGKRARHRYSPTRSQLFLTIVTARIAVSQTSLS